MCAQISALSSLANYRTTSAISPIPSVRRKAPAAVQNAAVQPQSTIVQISPQGMALVAPTKTSVNGAYVPLPTSSGDKNIDAVLARNDFWWHKPNAQAKPSNTYITPKVRQIDPDQSLHALKYSWLSGTESFLTNDEKATFASVSAGQKKAIKSAFDYLSTLINVTFTEETSTPTSANIMFGTNSQTSSAGYANYPNGNGPGNPSKLMLANNDMSGTLNNGANLGTKGSYGWETLIHELGHTMGLKHPGNYNAGGGKGPGGPYLPGNLDNRRMSIMSYNNPTNGSKISVSVSQSNGVYQYGYSLNPVNPATYGVFDIAAMQYLYGAKKDTVAADLIVGDSFSDIQTLWAPQGIKVNASTTTRSNIFDLREGAYSSISFKSKDENKAAIKASLKSSGLPDPKLEEASTYIMKKVGSKLYDGKNNLALSYGSKYGEVTGGFAGDQFFGSNYSVTIDGKDGYDVLYLAGKKTDWVVDETARTATNTKNQAIITYRNIEKIAYYKETSSVLHA